MPGSACIFLNIQNLYRLHFLKCSEIKWPYLWSLYSFCTDRYCGHRPPTNPLEVISSGNLMLINLITDSSIQRPGFEAQYSTIPIFTGIISISSHHAASLYFLSKCLTRIKWLIFPVALDKELISRKPALSVWCINSDSSLVFITGVAGLIFNTTHIVSHVNEYILHWSYELVWIISSWAHI